tara:strand:- start:443 stop:892 length:450 start_codon:yes stop_codon:yes gene_type:complete
MKKKTTPKPIKAHRGRIVYGPRGGGRPKPWNPWGPRPMPMPWGNQLPRRPIRRQPVIPPWVRSQMKPAEAVDTSRVKKQLDQIGTPTAAVEPRPMPMQSALRIPNPISQAPTRIANKGMLVPKKKAKGHHDYRKSGYFSKGGIIKKKKS